MELKSFDVVFDSSQNALGRTTEYSIQFLQIVVLMPIMYCTIELIFTGLIFIARQSSTKTTELGPSNISPDIGTVYIAI